MNILNDVSLADYSTMGLGGHAKYLTTVSSSKELDEVVAWAKTKNVPMLMIGSGSNIVWQDKGYEGLIILNRVKGFEIKQKGDKTELVIGAGEDWDSVVGRACQQGLSGIESLSLIPGTAGATPVQNVGAYGQEISSVLTNVHAYDTTTETYVDLTNADCKFSYRNSRFKSETGRYLILSMTLELTKTKMEPPFYASLEKYLTQHHIEDYSPSSIRDAVINIRKAKLPDPKVVKNCGSFFANPIISNELLTELLDRYNHEVPHWQSEKGQIKLSAAWLLDKAGFNNVHDKETGISTWPSQSLVLVNDSAKSTEALLRFKKKIVDTVVEKFGIALVQEPELLPK